VPGELLGRHRPWRVAQSIKRRPRQRGDRNPITNNLDALRRAIEAAGVALIEEDGKAVGIRAA
jgi:hypothetical protein